MIEQIENFFTSWRFPSFMISTLFLSWIMIMVMAFVPVTDSTWGAFAEDFKVWCFGYDPETGTMQWIYLAMFTFNPLMLVIVILFVWIEPLKEVYAKPTIITRYAVSSFAMVMVIGASFLLMYDVPAEENFEFRPDSLRIALTPPSFELINQNEEKVRLDDYRGDVVVLTSVYATCADTCPMILDQVKRVLDRLNPDDRDEVVLMAITMQPERDTPDLLKRVAGFYQLDNPNSHMLTGDPATVDNVLDKLNVSRYRDAETGVMDHVNLFYIIDREGKIAFRFTLGKKQEEWMTEALKLLIHEESPDVLTEILE